MAEQSYDTRPDEILIESDRRFLGTSKFDLDGSGRHIPIGITAGTPTIVRADEGRAIAEQKPYVRVVRGDRGVLPPRFAAGDSAGQDAFVGRKRELTRDQQINDLVRNEGLGPASLAAAALTLIEAGVFSREEAINWAREVRQVATLSGTGSKEPWIEKARGLVAKA